MVTPANAVQGSSAPGADLGWVSCPSPVCAHAGHVGRSRHSAKADIGNAKRWVGVAPTAAGRPSGTDAVQATAPFKTCQAAGANSSATPVHGVSKHERLLCAPQPTARPQSSSASAIRDLTSRMRRYKRWRCTCSSFRWSRAAPVQCRGGRVAHRRGRLHPPLWRPA